jgi:hypothetical protein
MNDIFAIKQRIVVMEEEGTIAKCWRYYSIIIFPGGG